MNGPHLFNELLVLIESQSLRAIGQSLFRLIVYFNDQAIRAYGDAGAGQWNHHVVFPRPVRWIDDHGQVRDAPDSRDRREIECVACVLRERAHTALAKDHVVIAFGHDVLGRE